MNWKKPLEETGKHLQNIGVAIIVFAILQPILKGEFALKTSLIFAAIYVVILVISIILLALGGEKDER